MQKQFAQILRRIIKIGRDPDLAAQQTRNALLALHWHSGYSTDDSPVILEHDLVASSQ